MCKTIQRAQKIACGAIVAEGDIVAVCRLQLMWYASSIAIRAHIPRRLLKVARRYLLPRLFQSRHVDLDVVLREELRQRRGPGVDRALAALPGQQTDAERAVEAHENAQQPWACVGVVDLLICLTMPLDQRD